VLAIPRFDRVILGRRAPGCARVVHQNVHPSELLDRFVREPLDVFVPGIVRCDPLRLDAETGKMRLRLFQIGRLAGGNHDPGPLLT
jgi:hypothetical protein